MVILTCRDLVDSGRLRAVSILKLTLAIRRLATGRVDSESRTALNRSESPIVIERSDRLIAGRFIV